MLIYIQKWSNFHQFSYKELNSAVSNVIPFHSHVQDIINNAQDNEMPPSTSGRKRGDQENHQRK